MAIRSLFAVAVLAAAVCAASAATLYQSNPDVIELTAANFESMVIKSNDLWLVEFYAPWCGHCKNLAPEWSRAATALKGIVKVGAVNMDEHQSVGSPYNVRGFPTIKFFGGNKNSPVDYNQARNADALTSFALQQAQTIVNNRLKGRASDSSSSSSSSNKQREQARGSTEDVVTLTARNFDELVVKGEGVWMVEFFAPWCGHCKQLAPEWASAASQLKGKVHMGAVDCTVETELAQRFNVRGYPTIMTFLPGQKDHPEDYSGGRSASDLVSYALSKTEQFVKPPEVVELTNREAFEACTKAQICIVSVLPDILDSGAAGRNRYIQTLKEVSAKFRNRPFNYVWTAAGNHPDLESKLNMGGSGYPALVAYNNKKGRYASLIGAFSTQSISTFLDRLMTGKESTAAVSGAPGVETVKPWDGKDGVPPSDEL